MISEICLLNMVIPSSSVSLIMKSRWYLVIILMASVFTLISVARRFRGLLWDLCLVMMGGLLNQ